MAARIGRQRWFRSLLSAGCLGAMFSAAFGQPGPGSEEAAIARALGNGVHSFFGGDYQRAYDDLSEAVAAGSRDPRALYFRGLAARRMGRIDEAEADFSQAASMEASALDSWPVSRTLERVQGQDRLALERHRVRSRIAALQARREATARRYSEIDSLQDSYLRRTRPREPAQDPAAEFERGAPAEPIAPGAGEEVDAEAGEAMPPEAEDSEAERDATPAADNPFAEQPADSAPVDAEPEMAEAELPEEPAERESPPADPDEPMAEEPPATEPDEKTDGEMAEEAPEEADGEPAAEDPATEPAEAMAEDPPADAPADDVFGN